MADSYQQEAARAAVASHVTFDTERIQSTLQNLYQDASRAGQESAAHHLGNWHPGDIQSAQQTAGLGLQNLLDRSGITIAGLTESAIERMGDILANGLNEGLSTHQIAQNMRDVVADPIRAEVISRTETARAQGVSALQAYADAGTEEWDWHSNAGACTACIENEENSPYPIDGGPGFPEHPNCRCQPLPHIV